MNYLKQYIKLIKKAERRDPKELEGLYIERHHVFPKSLYGENNRLVKLTFKEHLVAHHILYKACVKRYGSSHNNTIKMAWALSFMINTSYQKSVSSVKVAEYIRRLHHVKVPYKHTLEVKERISMLKKGKNTQADNHFYGRSHTQESIRKISDKTLISWVHDDGTIENNLTRSDLRCKYPHLTVNGLCQLVKRRISNHRGWRILA